MRFQPRLLRSFVKIRNYSVQPNRPNGFSNLKKAFGIGLGVGLTYSLFKSGINLEAVQDYQIDPDSGVKYDNNIPNIGNNLKLMGCGVRTVTILKFQAYSVAIYINEKQLSQFLNNNKEFENFDKSGFLDDKEYCAKFISKILDCGLQFAVRIVPVRSTNGPHLKGGLTRNIQYHLDQSIKDKSIHIEDKQKYTEILNEFGQYFPKGQIPMYCSYTFVKVDQGMQIWVQDQFKGKIDNIWLPNTLLLAYLTNTKVVSQQLRQSFADQVIKFIHEK